MKGKYRIIVSAKRLRYDFEVKQNLTIIRGDSATGKTTLVDMIQESMNNPSGSPVEVKCDKLCYVLSGRLWKEQLSAMKDSIVFIDEGNDFIKSDEFAREIQQTDNYYVIVSRESLPALPYSAEEIYGIRTTGKYGTLKQYYHEFYRIYGTDIWKNTIKPEVMVTEDSNSGYQFFHNVCKDYHLDCETVNGKSNVFHYLNMHKDKNILVIADGAAFGSEMDRVIQLIKRYKNAALYLPESFEWLILLSGIVKDGELQLMLDEPYAYIDSLEYFSWERFFTAILVEKTKDTYLTYTKKVLNQAYLGNKVKKAILAQIDKVIFDWKTKK